MAAMLRNEMLSEARALQRGLLAGWPMPVIDKLKARLDAAYDKLNQYELIQEGK